jgi:hypothetical protein
MKELNDKKEKLNEFTVTSAVDKFLDSTNKERNIEKKNMVRIYYDRNGKDVNAEVNPSYVAKMTFDKERGEKTAFYFIKMYRGQLLDPHSNDKTISQIKQRSFVERRVNFKCFDNYVKYLQTKNRTYFTRSRRLSMEN